MSLSVDDLLDGDFDVFAISTDRTRGGDLDMLHEKQWLAIVTTEWRERVELLHACKIQCAERARGVDGEWALLEIRWRKERIDFAREGLGKRLDARLRNRDARGHRVPAVPEQVRATRVKHLVQLDAFNAATRTLERIFVAREQDHWARVDVDEF